MSIKLYQTLKESLQVKQDDPIRVKLLTAQFADIDPEIQEIIGADARGVQPNPSMAHPIEFTDEGEYISIVDEFGIYWRKPKEGGLYYDMCKFPLSGLEDEDIEKYSFPDSREPSRFEGLSERIDLLSSNGEYPIVFDNCMGNGIFQMGNHLMGYDNFLVAFSLEEKSADYVMDKILDMKMEFWDEVLTRFGDRIDIVKELDDLGTQLNMMISPDSYRERIQPRLKKLVHFIKKKSPHVKMMMHSCGSMSKAIPALIDAGVEILNPLQYTANDMDPATLKKEYGKELTFWGGGIETQNIIPFGSAQDVEDECRRQMDILMPGGGFVFAQVHSLQWGVPLENVFSMWNTVKKYGRY